MGVLSSLGHGCQVRRGQAAKGAGGHSLAAPVEAGGGTWGLKVIYGEAPMRLALYPVSALGMAAGFLAVMIANRQ